MDDRLIKALAHANYKATIVQHRENEAALCQCFAARP